MFIYQYEICKFIPLFILHFIRRHLMDKISEIYQRENYPFWFSGEDIVFVYGEETLWRIKFGTCSAKPGVADIGLPEDISLPIVKVEENSEGCIFILDSSGKMFCKGAIKKITSYKKSNGCITFSVPNDGGGHHIFSQFIRKDEYHHFPSNYEISIVEDDDGGDNELLVKEIVDTSLSEEEVFIKYFYFEGLTFPHIITDSHVQTIKTKFVMSEREISIKIKFDKRYFNGCNIQKRMENSIFFVDEEERLISRSVDNGKLSPNEFSMEEINEKSLILFPSFRNSIIRNDKNIFFFATDIIHRENIYTLETSINGKYQYGTRYTLFTREDKDTPLIRIKKISSTYGYCLIWDELGNQILCLYIRESMEPITQIDKLNIIYKPEEEETIRMMDVNNGRVFVVLSSGKFVIFDIRESVSVISYGEDIYVNPNMSKMKKSALS